MKVTCLVTGAKFEFSNFQGCNIESIHPLLTAGIGELNSIPQSSKPTELFLLFAAFLQKAQELELVRWGKLPLQFSNYSPAWIMQTLDSLVRVVNWGAMNHTNSLYTRLPKIRISNATTPASIQGWLESACHILDTENFGWTNNIPKNQVKKFLGEFGTEYLDPKVSGAKSGSVVFGRARFRAKYIQESFKSLQGEGQHKFGLIKKAINKPNEFTATMLKQVKQLVLDLGLEDSVEQYNEKSLIISELDKAMLDKIGIQNLLGAVGKQDLDEIIDNVDRTFTLLTSTGTVVNKPIAGQVELIQGMKQAKIAVPKMNVPDAEPKEQDYPNRLAYLAAKKAWQLAQAGRA